MGADRGLVSKAVDLRISQGKSQSAFWQVFGLSQPAASRLESSGKGSPCLTLLLGLYFAGVVSEQDLQSVRVAG